MNTLVARLNELLRRVPWVLLLWLFLPMIAVGAAGEIFEDRLAGGKTPGNPSTLHALKWMLMTLFRPTPADDSWMPMSVALEVTKGPHASDLFHTVFFERHIKFQYPPSSLLPLEPLAALNLLRATFLNGLNTVVLLANCAVVGLLAHRLFAPRGAAGAPGAALPDRTLIALIAAGTGLCFYPIVQAQNLGQIQTWIDLAFGVACLSWLGGRPAAAGTAIGLACVLKPQLALFLPWALAWRRWRFAGGLVAALVPFELLSLARYGLKNHLDYLSVLSHLSRHGESFQFNQSVNGLMNRLLFNGCNNCPPFAPTPLPPFHPVVHVVTLAATLVLLALALVPPFRARKAEPTLLDFGVATLVFTMASPVAWYHHYGVVLPVFVIALRSAFDVTDAKVRRRAFVALGIAWALMSNYIGVFNLLAETRLNVLQSHLFFGALVLLGLLVWETRAAPRSRSAP